MSILVQFIHCRNQNNAGDMWSNPLNYLNVDASTISLDVSDCYDPTETVILGGGGVLKYSDRICKARHRVVWGAGVNRPRLRKSDTIPDLSEWDLIGIRDWNRGYPWVPCASCLHEVFDHPHDVTQEFVVMAGSPLEIRGLPSLRCNVGHQLTDIIRHLGSGETVVTSSYHGWYWATLLGRRVVVIPNAGASKFYHLRWPAPLTNIDDWRQASKNSRSYPEALSQARHENIKHMNHVSGVLGVHMILKNTSTDNEGV